MIFWDLQKASARVPWAGWGATLARFGCTEHFKTRTLHEGMAGTVSHKNSVTDEFPITGGLK